MFSKIKKQSEGFTIIEVLIVLAIAGLIMLIVFLAVPALQRNSRTTQVKNAAGAILTTMNEFVTNNNGQQPSAVTIAANGDIKATGAVGTNPATGKTQAGYTASVSAAPAAGALTGVFHVGLNSKCNPTGTGYTPAVRAFAVTYTVESNGTTIVQCNES